MARHFLLTPACRPLPLHKVFRISEDQAYRWFCKARWPETKGEPWCPRCGVVGAWEIRRRRFKCREKTCCCEFSVTSGAIFASHIAVARGILDSTVPEGHRPNGDTTEA